MKILIIIMVILFTIEAVLNAIGMLIGKNTSKRIANLLGVAFKCLVIYVLTYTLKLI